MNNETQEHVYRFTFEVGRDEFLQDMTLVAADQEEAERTLRERLSFVGMGKLPFRLLKKDGPVGKRTRIAARAS